MLTPTRVYLSVPNDHNLQADQLDIKRGIIDRIKSVGFEPQELFFHGEFSQIPWSYEKVQYKLSRCQGAVILGLIRWDVQDAQREYKFNTAYNHYEGALALSKDLPSFILMHEHVKKAGIALKGRAQFFVKLPDKVYASWLQTDTFLSKFYQWVDAVKDRRHIFLGYSRKARATAAKIKDFLTGKGVSVLEWGAEFNPSVPLIDEIEKASRSCLGSIFLFVNDDEVNTSDIKSAQSRDDIIFAAGYLMHSKGMDKTLFISEGDAIIPAALDRAKISTLQNREDISPLEKDLEEFIIRNL